MRIGIRVRVLIFFLAVAIFVSLFSGFFMYTRYRAILVDQTKDNIRITKEVGLELNDLMLLIEKGGNYISFDQTIAEALHTEVEDGIVRAHNITAFSDEFKKTYDLLLGSDFSSYFLNFYINPDLPVASFVEDGKRTLWGMNIYNLYYADVSESWYREALAKDGAIHIFRSEKPGDTYIYIAKLIKNQSLIGEDFEEVLGASVVGIDAKQILNRLERRKITDSMQFAVSDNTQTVLCKTSDTLEDDFIQTVLTENVPSVASNSVEVDNRLINIERTSMGLYLMSFTSLKDIYSMTGEIRSILFISIMVSVALATVISLILSASFTKPIEKLAGVMLNATDEEQKSISSKGVTNDEVGDLYQAFGKLIRDLDEKNQHTRELELQMYQLQINPHFLYNTLDSIAWKAITNKQTDIVDMIEDLSEIFKYSVKGHGQLAKLIDEVQIVNTYVDLQKKRIAREIHFQYDISPDAASVMVPKCILQPLIENSILHAGNCVAEKLEITMRAYLEAGKVVIKIQDNGTAGAAEKINRYLRGEDIIFSNGELGIKNVNMRIKLRFGENSGLYYEKNEMGGTTAVILIENHDAI